MSEKLHPYEHIEQYLEGTLNDQEKTRFEAQIAADENLSEEVALHRDLAFALSDDEVIALEQLLIKIRAGESKQINIRPLWSRKPYLSIAAAILFICVLAFLFWPKPQPADYVAYFDTYPLYLSTRSADNHPEQPLNALHLSYAEGDYEAALSNLNTLLQKEPTDKVLPFYQAYCQYKLGQLVTAESAFQEIIKEGDSAYIPPAEWYLVDVYLQQNKRAEAIQLLKIIKDKEGDYQLKATDLLNDLK
jgi:TolA-binding protein